MTLSPSDWLQIVTFMAGIAVSVFLSWLFYRAQQKTDYQKLTSEVQGLKLTLEAHTKSVDELSPKSSDQIVGLERLQGKVDALNQSLTQAVHSIVGEVKQQQTALSSTIQERFSAQSLEAVRIIRELLASDLSRLVPAHSQRDAVIEKFVDIVNHAIKQLGDFQRLNLQQQSSTLIDTIEQRVGSSIAVVVSEVKDIKEAVRALPALALAPARPPKAKK
jgi:hypothetical protein